MCTYRKIILQLAILGLVSGLHSYQEEHNIWHFKDEYVLDKNFANNFVFKDVTDIAINSPLKQVLVLQRSLPPVTIWDTNGTFIFAWETTEVGYPHSITLNGSDPSTATVWITDMAGPLTTSESYGHHGKFIRSIGKCGEYTNGSSLNPIQFDKVTDFIWNSNTGFYYITDGDLGGLNNHVLVFDTAFKLVDVWNAENIPGSGPMQFHLPHTIAIDMCNRVWITDVLNHRVQIISGEGNFLGELNCFGNNLIYGLDFIHTNGKQSVLLTTKDANDNHSELVSVPIKMECSNIKDIGECKVERRFVLSLNASKNHSLSTNSMLHSVTVDPTSGDLYLTQLPGNTPPLKFSPGAHPPVGNQGICSENPPDWPMEWNTTVLLTPYTSGDHLMTAEMMYSAQNRAMYVQLGGPTDKHSLEMLTIEDLTYTIERDELGKITCLGPVKQGWSTPAADWLSNRNCKCQGLRNTAGVQGVLWQCPNYEFVDWFWFEQAENKPWRIFFNNNTNPSRIPVLGNYTMISFASHGTDTKQLKVMVDACTSQILLKLAGYQKHTAIARSNFTLSPPTFVKGFSYEGCSGNAQLRNWPDQFYLTATMLPVTNYDPLPTGVVYDWSRQSQHTMMYSTNSTTSAYLIRNNTYILERNLDDKVACISHLKFGPPNPHWMFQDKCQCMGTISHNRALSPWPLTIIAMCPIEDNRVFWTWFGTTNKYKPVIFFETLSPPGEGTSLAFADYHDFYPDNMLVDLQDFEVPRKCLR